MTLPVGKDTEAYTEILPYLSTLDNPEDTCKNILTFYESVNYWLTNDTNPERFVYPLANPYNKSSESVSIKPTQYL